VTVPCVKLYNIIIIIAAAMPNCGIELEDVKNSLRAEKP
jgi:hypothetical protein